MSCSRNIDCCINKMSYHIVAIQIILLFFTTKKRLLLIWRAWWITWKSLPKQKNNKIKKKTALAQVNYIVLPVPSMLFENIWMSFSNKRPFHKITLDSDYRGWKSLRYFTYFINKLTCFTFIKRWNNLEFYQTSQLQL